MILKMIVACVELNDSLNGAWKKIYIRTVANGVLMAVDVFNGRLWFVNGFDGV